MNRRILTLGARFVLPVALLLSAALATAASPAAEIQQTTQGTLYTVRAGDNWVIIANMFGVSADRLIDYNGLRSRPDLIYVGEVIHIPITVGSTPSNVSPFYYVVQAGDTIQSLVTRFEIDETALLTANGLSSRSAALTPGATLLIPAGPHHAVVAAGETLADVATRYSTTVARLLRFNPHIANASAVYPGTNVFVPIQYNVVPTTPSDGTTTTTTAPQSVIPAASVGTQVSSAITVTDSTTQYTVQAGDTWPKIQRMFGVDAATLIDANNLRSRPDLIYVGEKITIPIALGFTPSFVNPFLYLAQAGDTLQTLLNVFEIDKSSVLSANRLSTSLDNNTPLTVGETLLIPAGPHRTTVKPGETLADVAARYSTTSSKLLQYNSHLSQTPVAGQHVYVPVQLNVPFVAAPGLAEGTGGGGEGATTSTTAATTTTSIADPGGPLTIRWVVIRSVRRDPAFGSETGRVIVSLALEFRGGQTPFTLLHERAETTYTGPFLRADNNTDYTDLDFDVAGVVCGGGLVATVELRSADGQTATHLYYVTVPCPT